MRIFRQYSIFVLLFFGLFLFLGWFILRKPSLPSGPESTSVNEEKKFNPPFLGTDKSQKFQGQGKNQPDPFLQKAPPGPIHILSQNDFRELTHKALSTLPRQDDARGMTGEEVHFTPPSVVARIEPLIQIRRAVRENPALEVDALAFYRQCATNSILMNSVRARCLSGLRSLSRKRGQPVDYLPYPPRIRQLSEFLPD